MALAAAHCDRVTQCEREGCQLWRVSSAVAVGEGCNVRPVRSNTGSITGWDRGIPRTCKSVTASWTLSEGESICVDNVAVVEDVG